MCNVGEIIAELLNETKDTHSVSQLEYVLDSDTVSKAQLWLLFSIKLFIKKLYM